MKTKTFEKKLTDVIVRGIFDNKTHTAQIIDASLKGGRYGKFARKTRDCDRSRTRDRICDCRGTHNYLTDKGVNAFYMMFQNVDGDDRNVWPWVGTSQSQAKQNSDRFDVAKLQVQLHMFFVLFAACTLYLCWSHELTGADELAWIVALGLGVLLLSSFLHELGHYLVARWNKVDIDAFAVGFGPELFGFNDRHGTRWKLCVIPLGGYVKFKGDANAASAPDFEETSQMSEAEKAGSFMHKRVGQRAAVVAAGPIANFILAIVIFTGTRCRPDGCDRRCR